MRGKVPRLLTRRPGDPSRGDWWTEYLLFWSPNSDFESELFSVPGLPFQVERRLNPAGEMHLAIHMGVWESFSPPIRRRPRRTYAMPVSHLLSLTLKAVCEGLALVSCSHLTSERREGQTPA